MARPNKQGSPEKGTSGAYTWFVREGVPLMRVSYANTTKRQPTEDEMVNRLLVMNTPKLWQQFQGKDKPSFEDCKPLQSDYSRFFSINRKKAEPIYLTKQMVEAGACVLTHAVISGGSLPRIEQERDGQQFVSDISVGAIRIDASTTVAQLSAAIINSNQPGRFQETDVIACFLGQQRLDADTGYPTVTILSNRLFLDASDTTPLSDVIAPGAGFEVTPAGFLAFTAPSLTLGSYVHTRRNPWDEDGHDLASPQDFLGDNPLIVTFGTPEAFKRASDSYGGFRRAKYLRPRGNVKIKKVVPATGGSTGGQGGNSGNSDPTNPGGGNTNPGGGNTNPGGGGGDGEDGFSR